MAKPDEVDDLAQYKCKPSDLPMYAPLHSNNKPAQHPHSPKSSVIHSRVESGVRVVRTEVQSGLHYLSSHTESLQNHYETGKAHTQSTLDYLNEPQNILPRSGAIAIGGLAGLIFAARRGFFRKLLYTGVGAGTVASLCYPTQAEHFARDALFEARKGYAIAYNFVKGIKPGGEIPVEPINKFPSSVQDIKYMLLDLYDEAKESLFSSNKKKE